MAPAIFWSARNSLLLSPLACAYDDLLATHIRSKCKDSFYFIAETCLKQETSRLSQNAHPLDESGACQFPSEPSQQDKVSLPEMVTHLQVALRASERAREEGRNESSALRRYLAEVEVAAAGLVSRVQELEHLLALSTASQGNKDLDQLRGQMLMVTARDARQHAIAAAQAISTARQATMQLDQVKREASALTSSQEEEIKRLNTDLQRCHDLLQERDVLLQELEKEEEKLIERCSALEGAVNASQIELAGLKKQIHVKNEAAEEKALRFEELVQTLEFTKAAARATEHRLQVEQSQKKVTAFQNEFLQHEVAELQSREVQTTIAHYDFELCKVRAVLEREKTHLLAELAKLRHGNQSLKGEVAEWRGKYNTMLKKVSCGEEMDSTALAHEPAEISFAKLRKFFSTDCLEEGAHMTPDLVNATTGGKTTSGGGGPMSQGANCSGRQDSSDGQQLCIQTDDEEHRITELCFRGGEENITEYVSASRLGLNFQETNEGRLEPLLISDGSEIGRFCTSEVEGPVCFDKELCTLDKMLSENGQRICLAGRGEVEQEFVCISGRPLEIGLDARKPVEGEEKYFFSKSSLEAQDMRENGKKSRSVSFVDQLTHGHEDDTLAIRDETYFEMGENLLAVAHRELCKLKRGKRGDSGRIPFSASLRLFGPIIFFLLRVVTRKASRHTNKAERDLNDMVYQGLKFLDTKLDFN